VFVHAQEEDADHLLVVRVGNDQGWPESAFALPAMPELVQSLGCLPEAARRRDRNPDRLLDVGIVAVADERLDVAFVWQPDDEPLAAERLLGRVQLRGVVGQVEVGRRNGDAKRIRVL
jgi:hypothetical protein